MKRFIFFIGFIILTQCAFANIIIGEARVWPGGDKTKLVFDTSKPATFKSFTLRNPDRIVLDINDAKFSRDFSKLSLSQTPIDKIRVSKRSGDDVRIVLDLKQAANYKSYYQAPKGRYGHRLIVDLTTRTPLRVSNSDRDVVIALDPGHGGKDPGAISQNNIREKNVVLAIAKKLQLKLNKEPGIKAVLTRDGDYYIGLRERLKRARQAKADIFISIHADAFKNAKARGVSVFALSERGASSEAARWLADKENYSELLGGASLDVSDKTLRAVLLDLSQNASNTASLRLGEKILSFLGNVAKLHGGKVETARFVVLKSPDIPSLLIETGFISNPTEAARLNSGWYQQRLADAIASGVSTYYKRWPPPGTRLAAQRQLMEYIVARGDSLSKIAKRYGTSVAKLKAINNLRTTALNVGQRLQIP